MVNDGVEIKKILEEINKAYSNIGECVICFEETQLNNVLDPCGHNCVCSDCIQQGLAKECPICRAEVLNVVVLYNQLQVDQKFVKHLQGLVNSKEIAEPEIRKTIV